MNNGQQVEVYRNLNRRGICFSFRDKKTKLVIGRIDLTLGQVGCLFKPVFKVSKAGRARVIREKRKNVHALICGELCGTKEFDGTGLIPFKVSYDPYKTDRFLGHNAEYNQRHMCVRVKLDEAEYVTFDGNGVTAWVNDSNAWTRI